MLERYYNSRDIAVLKGKTITSVEGLEDGGKEIKFTCGDGTAYKMFHQQDGDEVVFASKIDRIESFIRTPEAVFRSPENEDECEECERYADQVLMRRITDALLNAPVTFAERIIFDRELIPSRMDGNKHLDPHGMQKTLFLIATSAGCVSITWTGCSDDPMESTEVDFVQTEGEGVWREGSDR